MFNWTSAPTFLIASAISIVLNSCLVWATEIQDAIELQESSWVAREPRDLCEETEKQTRISAHSTIWAELGLVCRPRETQGDTEIPPESWKFSERYSPLTGRYGVSAETLEGGEFFLRGYRGYFDPGLPNLEILLICFSPSESWQPGGYSVFLSKQDAKTWEVITCWKRSVLEPLSISNKTMFLDTQTMSGTGVSYIEQFLLRLDSRRRQIVELLAYTVSEGYLSGWEPMDRRFTQEAKFESRGGETRLRISTQVFIGTKNGVRAVELLSLHYQALLSWDSQESGFTALTPNTKEDIRISNQDIGMIFHRNQEAFSRLAKAGNPEQRAELAKVLNEVTPERIGTALHARLKRILAAP